MRDLRRRPPLEDTLQTRSHKRAQIQQPLRTSSHTRQDRALASLCRLWDGLHENGRATLSRGVSFDREDTGTQRQTILVGSLCASLPAADAVHNVYALFIRLCGSDVADPCFGQVCRPLSGAPAWNEAVTVAHILTAVCHDGAARNTAVAFDFHADSTKFLPDRLEISGSWEFRDLTAFDRL